MSLLLLFAYPNPLSIPISELVTTEPVATNGYPIQRPATSGEWRWVVELADTADGDSALWRDITPYYVGDRYQRGADEYLGRYRAAIAQVQLQIDDSDMLAPWGQDTSSIFGVDVRLDAGMLMRASLIRVVSGLVEEWSPIWTGRVESWGDASAARGQVRTHVVTVIDTSADLANVPTVVLSSEIEWPEYFTDNVLPQAGWLFGVDTYGDSDGIGLPFDDVPVAAINRLDNGTDPLGLIWRTLRSGRLVIYPAPWNTTNVERYPNPLLDVYPDGLKFSYSPDLTDIEYIADDDQQPFGVQRTNAGVINSLAITHPTDTDPETYLNDDPVSISRYGVRPLTASWITWNGDQIADDIIESRAYATAQALPLRTTLDHEGFWSAMAIIDHLDPVTIWHATQEAGLVVTGTGVVRNIVEERTFRGTDGDTAELNWQSTVQIDLDETESTPALLPVENLTWLSSTTPGFGGPSSAEFSWTNPTQPDVTPTEVQLRVLGRSPLWFSEDYPGVGADGTTLGWLNSGTYYTLQVRLLRRVDGVVTHVSAIRSVKFQTPLNIFPTPIPGDDPTDTDVDMPPFDDCEDDVSIELQENDGTGWVTVDTFSGTEIEQDDNGHWHLSVPIPNSFFNEGSMYRYLGFCGDELIVTGPEFDPPDDWTDPCPDPAALSVPPFDDPSLLVYVPKVCTGFEDADPAYLFEGMLIIEAVSGIAGAHGDALGEIRTGITDPTSHALAAIADPDWSDTPGGIVAYGECPQIVGHTGSKTWTVRTKIVQAEACVLFECAGGRITCVPTSGGWRAAIVVYKASGTTITLPTATELDEGTVYVITATFELATGNVTIQVDGVNDNSVGGTDNEPTINALPIWRVGAPPESWITDCALFGDVVIPFSPDQISGMEAWYDAADLATITAPGGNNVTLWADKSGNGHNVTGPGNSNTQTGTRTQNSLNVIDFNGTTPEHLTSTSPFWFGLGTSTMFIVFQCDGNPPQTNGHFVYEASTVNTVPLYGLRYDSSNMVPVYRSNDNVLRVFFNGPDPTDSTPHFATWTDSGTVVTISQDSGTPVSSSAYARATTSLDRFTIGWLAGDSAGGDNQPLDGWIAEIIIYDSVLSSGDITLVETYLADKWGL